MKTFQLLAATTLVGLGIIAAQPALADTSTQDFVNKVAISDKFEIESSKLALQKAQSADVKSFAQQMVTDHTKTSSELQAALPKTSVDPSSVPTALDDKHQDLLSELSKATGKDFDEKYLDAQEKAHEQAVSLFTDYSKSGEDATLKAWAAKTLPALEQHKDHVEELE